MCLSKGKRADPSGHRCRSATSPDGEAFCGRSPKKAPLTGELAELARPEGFCRLALIAPYFL